MNDFVSVSSGLVSARLGAMTGILESPSRVAFGTVSRIVGMTIEAKGLMVSLGTICLIETSSGLEIEAQVVGFKEDAILLMPFGLLVLKSI